jgi:hypothetical protein
MNLSPTLKGAFLKFEGSLLGLPDIVVFQFNPETVTRAPSMSQTDAGGAGEARDPRYVAAYPTESYSFSLRLDATDQLAAANPLAAESGILPALSALELLMYPVPATGALLALPGGDSPYTSPPNLLPVVLFFWGPYRLLPVNITSLSISEVEYDPHLSPTRAEVSVSLQVVTPPALAPGLMQDAYRYTQSVKEVMAAANLASSAELAASMAFPIPLP